MSFTASFKSRGAKKDKANFKKQYGAPTSSKGRVCTYNYDNYTNIILDCSKGRCYSRCMYKMD